MSRTNKDAYLSEPTRELIQEYIDKYNNTEAIQIDEKAVESVFRTFNVNSIECNLVKSIVLNNRYSTGLNNRPTDIKDIAIDVYTISVIIQQNYSICKSAEEVVKYIETISSLVAKKSKKRPYSFLSKTDMPKSNTLL